MTTRAFDCTNPTGELITSGLPVNLDLCNDVRAYTLRSANQEFVPGLRYPASNCWARSAMPRQYRLEV